MAIPQTASGGRLACPISNVAPRIAVSPCYDKPNELQPLAFRAPRLFQGNGPLLPSVRLAILLERYLWLMSYPLMQCGCRAQGEILTERGPLPFCVVHDCGDVAPTPDLTGRQSRCCYCKSTRPSELTLPFFVYHPAKPTDEHYCGCRGWD